MLEIVDSQPVVAIAIVIAINVDSNRRIFRKSMISKKISKFSSFKKFFTVHCYRIVQWLHENVHIRDFYVTKRANLDVRERTTYVDVYWTNESRMKKVY